MPIFIIFSRLKSPSLCHHFLHVLQFFPVPIMIVIQIMTLNWRLTVKHQSHFWPFVWPLLVCQAAVLPGGSGDASRRSSLERSSACCRKGFGIQKAGTEAYSYHSTGLHVAYCSVTSSFLILLMQNASNLTVDDKFERLISVDLPPSVHPCEHHSMQSVLPAMKQ